MPLLRVYALAMFRLTAIILLVTASPALAMNWEGHDDWMTAFAPSVAFEEAVPEARPLPSRDCPVRAEQLAANPYEQVPLPRHNCKPQPAKTEPRR